MNDDLAKLCRNLRNGRNRSIYIVSHRKYIHSVFALGDGRDVDCMRSSYAIPGRTHSGCKLLELHQSCSIGFRCDRAHFSSADVLHRSWLWTDVHQSGCLFPWMISSPLTRCYPLNTYMNWAVPITAVKITIYWNYLASPSRGKNE